MKATIEGESAEHSPFAIFHLPSLISHCTLRNNNESSTYELKNDKCVTRDPLAGLSGAQRARRNDK
jgi:hypothetical protein